MNGRSLQFGMDAVQTMIFLDHGNPDMFAFQTAAGFTEDNKYIFPPAVSMGNWDTAMVPLHKLFFLLYYRLRLVPSTLADSPNHQFTNTWTLERWMTAHFPSSKSLRHSRLRLVTPKNPGNPSLLCQTKASYQMPQSVRQTCLKSQARSNAT